MRQIGEESIYAKAALIPIDDLRKLEALDRTALSAPDKQAVEVLRRAGMLAPIPANLAEHYIYLTEDERRQARQDLSALVLNPPLSEQIIRDRGD